MPSGRRQNLSISSDFTSRLNDAILLPGQVDPIETVYMPSGMMLPVLLLPESNLEDVLVTALAWTEVDDTLSTDGS